MSDNDREERAFRDAFRAHADEAPTEPIRFEPPRRRVAWAAVAAAAAVVVLVVGVVQFARPGAPHDPDPAPSSPVATEPSATHATDDPTELTDSAEPKKDPAVILANGSIDDVAVTPGEPDSRAVLWRNNKNHVVAVTDDGFETRSLHQFRGWVGVDAVGEGKFAVTIDRRRDADRVWLVDASGGSTVVQVDPAISPAKGGEVVIAPGRVDVDHDVLAIDPSAGTAHRVPVPVETMHWVAFGGRIQTVVRISPDEPPEGGEDPMPFEYHWSDDGGATWHQEPMIGNWITIFEPVPTAAGTAHAVLQTSDGATMAPYGGVHTMPAAGGGFSRSTPERDATRATFHGSFRHEERQLIFADLWDEDRAPPTESGLYRIVGGFLERVETNIPEVMRLQPQVLGQEMRAGADPAVWIHDHERGLYRSEDGGETWDQYASQ